MNSPRDALDIAFGQNLRARRQANRMSLEELGRRINVTYQQIQKYETGANRVAVSTAARIATALDCSITDLFAGVGDNGDRAASSRALRLAGLFDRLPERLALNVEALVESVIDTDRAAQAAGMGRRPDASLRTH